MKKPLAPADLNELVVGLNKLARNLWWSWDQEAQELFQELSPRELAEFVSQCRGRACTKSRITNCACGCRTRSFACRVRQVLKEFDAFLNDQNTWAQAHAPALFKNPVAYFSAEFGFHESLPISAGGLGILAGDHAKSASDLGLGFVGISLVLSRRLFSTGRSIPGQLADGILQAD